MSGKILFISEALSAPFDEGIKNVAFSIYTQLRSKRGTLTVTNIENEIYSDNILKIKMNKLLLNTALRECLNDYSPNIILYLPESSVTISSFLRAKILKMMGRSSKVVILGIQHREYSPVQKFILSHLLKPDLLLLLGRSDEEYFITRGFNVKTLPPAVDTSKFYPPLQEEKEKIRTGFNISNDKFVVLHVGHIKVNRNIECLIDIQKIDNMQVVIVGSTSIIVEEKIKNKLIESGIIVIDKFVPDISKVYKMSDLYVFPVKSGREAIEMPLSVLEAMACNLSVVTTRFRGLIEHFKEDDCFRFFDHERELAGVVKKMIGIKARNREKMGRFTWDNFSDAIITAVSEL